MVPLFWAAFAPPDEGEPAPTFRRQFMIGFAGFLVFYVCLLHWILYLSNQEVTVPGIMFPSLLFLSAYLAVFSGMAVAVAGTVERSGGLPAVATLPFFWSLMDRLRGMGTLAYPWGSLGYSLAIHPMALQLTAWTGFWFLTFWIVAVNGRVYSTLRTAPLDAAGVGRRGSFALLALAVPLAFGAAILSRAPRLTEDAGRGLRLALIQPNTSREIKWKEGYEGVVVEDLLARTEIAAARNPDLIVWPETAAPVLITWEPELEAKVHEVIARLQRHVLVGTLDAMLFPGGRREDYNAAILYDPQGRVEYRYYKQRLVPFSEAMPFQKQIPWINALNFGQSDFTAGRARDLFRMGENRFSVLICFESIFPEISRQAVRDGAQYLINTTNDFWFGRSAAPAQHAEMAICRAVENRTPLARCANSGISFFVDPYGRVLDRTDIFVEAMPVARLATGTGGSFYTRRGEWFSWVLLFLGVLSIGQALWNRRGMRRVRVRSEAT